MKTCLKCNELNGGNADACYKCGAKFGSTTGAVGATGGMSRSPYSTQNSFSLPPSNRIKVVPDSVATSLQVFGNILIVLSIVAAVGCFILAGNLFGVSLYYRTSFNFWAALCGGVVGLLVTVVPGLVLLAASKLLIFTQLGNEYAKATFNSIEKANANAVLEQVLEETIKLYECASQLVGRDQ